MEKWEYLSVELQEREEGMGMFAVKRRNANDFTNQLNFYGLQGWELVSCITPSSYRGTTEAVFAIFKRKII